MLERSARAELRNPLDYAMVGDRAPAGLGTLAHAVGPPFSMAQAAPNLGLY